MEQEIIEGLETMGFIIEYKEGVATIVDRADQGRSIYGPLLNDQSSTYRLPEQRKKWKQGSLKMPIYRVNDTWKDKMEELAIRAQEQRTRRDIILLKENLPGRTTLL